MTLFGKQFSRQQIDEALLVAVSSSVFLPIKASSIIIILAAVFFLFDKRLTLKLPQLFSHKLGLLLIGFYGIQLVSAIVSQNSQEGFMILERRLSFLLFPILLLGQSSSTTVKRVCLGFSFTCIVVILICLGGAYLLFLESKDWGVYFYHNLSSIVGLNAIYLSIYCAFSLFVLLYYFKGFGAKLRRITAICMAFLLFSLILLSSKMMLFASLLGIFIFFVLELKNIRQRWILFLSILVFFSLIMVIKPVRQRFTLELNSNTDVLKLNHYKYDTPFTGLTLRLVIWKFSFEILHEKKAALFGVGIGDFQDLLNQKYLERGIYVGNKQLGDRGYIGYGPHNQWIETLFSMGLIGLLYFIILVSFIISHYIKMGNLLAILFFMIFILVSFTECVLSTNKGIVFFAFFICLFNGYNCRTISNNNSIK